MSTSDADDAAFQALEDVAAIAGELDDILVVGGQMAFLLLTAFPATGSPFHAFCSVWSGIGVGGPSVRKPRVRTAPQLDVLEIVIDERLRLNAEAPLKQRHAAERVFARLVNLG